MKAQYNVVPCGPARRSSDFALRMTTRMNNLIREDDIPSDQYRHAATTYFARALEAIADEVEVEELNSVFVEVILTQEPAGEVKQYKYFVDLKRGKSTPKRDLIAMQLSSEMNYNINRDYPGDSIYDNFDEYAGDYFMLALSAQRKAKCDSDEESMTLEDLNSLIVTIEEIR